MGLVQMGSEEFSSFFFAFLTKGQTTAMYCKNGEFHPDPVCTNPVLGFLAYLGQEKGT